MPSLTGLFTRQASSSQKPGRDAASTCNVAVLQSSKKKGLARAGVRVVDASSSTSSSRARAQAARHRACDVGYGPAPPRGSVTKEKLFYLDWRLAHIRDSRLSSEHTECSWQDGRDTIGRTSIEVVDRKAEELEVGAVEHGSDPDGVEHGSESQGLETGALAAPVAPETVPPRAAGGKGAVPVAMAARDPDARAYADEKATGAAALKQALGEDSALGSVPHLRKDAHHCDSDASSDEDHHPPQQQHRASTATGETAAAPPADIQGRSESVFRRVGSRWSVVGKRDKSLATSPRTGGGEADKRTSLRGRGLHLRLWQG